MYRAKSAPSGRFPLFEAVEELSRLPPRQRKRFFLGEYSDEIEGGPLDIRVAGSPRARSFLNAGLLVPPQIP
jgi:hypothetical protein